ncbi:MAG: DUF998 domain-containing protein [Anaerolineales bacterium]|nr:DUF998 domain-containing protein [Anaerolineales bacterium]
MMQIIDLRKLGPWAGIAAAVLFASVALVEGALRAGYDPISMFISELSLGPRGWVQITSFVLIGGLILLFTLGLAAEFKTGKASRFGPLLMALVSLSVFIAGVAVMDPVSTPVSQLSLSGKIHNFSALLAFTCMPLAAFVFYRRFRTDPNWQPIANWTLLAGILMLLGSIVLNIASSQITGRADNILTPWGGLIQSAFVFTFYAWVFSFALRLRHLS